jgi:hypothetical protein
LAFEVHNAAAAARKKGQDSSAAIAELETAEVHPSFLDIFHYTFCYIGIMTGNCCFNIALQILSWKLLCLQEM